MRVSLLDVFTITMDADKYRRGCGCRDELVYQGCAGDGNCITPVEQVGTALLGRI